MQRPYTICHILSALDGKIAGEFMKTKSAQAAGREYARIRAEYQADAWLYGTVTTKEFTNQKKPDIDLTAEASEKIPDGDFIAKNNAALYYVSVDTQGEIGWESGTFRREGAPDAHIIEILTEKTPPAYRAYLRSRRVSYILAGRESLEVKTALEKLYRLFKIKKLLICGGGTINWTFVQEQAADELSLILAPAADGSVSAASVFKKFDFLSAGTPAEFKLKKAKLLKESCIQLIYTAKNEKSAD